MDDGQPPMTPRAVAARTLPVPATVSPALRRSIAAAALIPAELFRRVPQTPEQWRAMAAANNDLGRERLRAALERFPAQIELASLGDVTVRRITPASLDPAHKDRVLLHFHGGAYVISGGDVSVTEGVLGAHHARTPVLSVDYRMPPDHPFPAAVDDAVTAWRTLIAGHAPGSVGVFGTSAGGGLLLAMTLKLKALGLPLPGALAPGTPWSDLTGASDSYAVHAGVDGVLPAYEGLLAGCARLYAGAAALDDPLVSPVNGDFAGFPPTLLTTGTRDILLSDTVRVHRAMRRAGVDARLEVYEALSHAEYNQAIDAPESAEVFTDIAAFFERHLSAG